ncbi:uncharacterized protein LOC117504283 [Thalassophryne amazonica]|uniref:uncharacterized protein LOC117504283 n=1 Tax=Thalassophryne amazonica TaxID=390379 RepID=UPI0014720F8C|nr:uncharacterized protein LOC117504283 [Thalassophryne amazonica]
MNYVLFCHHKGQMKELQIQDEGSFHKVKRSCLRPSRRGSTEEKTIDTINTAAAATDTEATHKAKEADRKTVDITELHSLIRHERHKPLVDIIRNRHRGARIACMKEKLSQRRQQELHDSTSGLRQRQKIHQQLFKPEPHLWGDSTSVYRKHSKKQTGKSPQVLTYHQIPLLTLDWNKPQGSDGVEDIWTGGATSTLSPVENMENAPSVSDIWETFLNGTDKTLMRVRLCVTYGRHSLTGQATRIILVFRSQSGCRQQHRCLPQMIK